jgi:hypothetical protein
MSDLFISYAATDRETAERLAARLELEGWSVWWDRQMPVGVSFDVAIDQALNQARGVVVLWSPVSVISDWVKSEAGEAKRRGRPLLPVVIRTTEIPLEFRRIQTIDLTGWPEVPREKEFQRLLAGLRQAVPVSQASPKAEPAAVLPSPTFEPRAEAVASRLGHPGVEKLLSNSYDRWSSGSLDHLFRASKSTRKKSREDFVDELNTSWGVPLRAALRGRVVADGEFVVVANTSFVLTSEMLYVFDKGELNRVTAITLRDVISYTSSGWWTKTMRFELASGEHLEIAGMETVPTERALISLLKGPPP